MFKMFKRKLKEKSGFTLIELIVVIAILGLLAVIAVPRFSAVQTNAEESANKATARTIMSAISMAEAKYSTNNVTVASINEFLQTTINETIGATDPVSGTVGTWHLNYSGNRWTVYKDGTVISTN